MTQRLDQERENLRKQVAETKRLFSLTPQEFFNPMGFTIWHWLVAGFGLFTLLIAVAVLVRS